VPSLPGTGCPSAGFCWMHLPRLTDAYWDDMGLDLSVSALGQLFLDTYINNSRWEDTNEATPSCNEWAKAPAK
jgi:hypothetical protein